MVVRFKPETGFFSCYCHNLYHTSFRLAGFFFCSWSPQISTAIMVLRSCIIVKTTIDMNCTKGFEEIFNKLTGLQEII
jgi:hypothetical protein